jgi:hypothetical protein
MLNEFVTSSLFPPVAICTMPPEPMFRADSLVVAGNVTVFVPVLSVLTLTVTCLPSVP